MVRRVLFAWLCFSFAIVAVSLVTGYRASRVVGEPQYLFTKTRVIAEVERTPADETEAEVQRQFAAAGESTTEPETRPMFVLGLLDAALPLVVASGLIAVAIALILRRRRIAARDGAAV